MVMTVMIVLGIGIINGLIIKRFLFYRLWKPKRGRTCEGKLGTCDSRCFVGSELHDDAIVLKIGHSAAVASVCPVDFRISPDAVTRDPFPGPFRLFAKGSVESTHKCMFEQGVSCRILESTHKVEGTDQPLPHETLPRSGRATQWTNKHTGREDIL